nr:acyl-homoserine-lactone synthase [Candidatus Symbiopectobacterium endolongispinus]
MSCFDGKEFDKFDNEKTDYIFGMKNGVIICGTSIIDVKHHNMLNDTFSSFFKEVNLPEGKFIESTRFLWTKIGLVHFLVTGPLLLWPYFFH